MKYVMFCNEHGSIGILSVYRTDGPFKGNPAYKVVYNFGKDVYGDPITDAAYHGHADPRNFLSITKKEYDEYTACRAWSKEQKAVRKKILKRLTSAENRLR
jgi:hypothetical protein